MRWLRAGLATVGTIAVLELLLRGLVGIETSGPLRALASRLQGDAPTTSESWAAHYLRQVDSGKIPFAKSALFAAHPTRGWTLAPNASVWIEGYRYTTNAQGHRSTVEPDVVRTRPRIMVLGDSQTFGEDVDDAFPWPTVLGRDHAALEIVNLAVGGYGLDQMLVTYNEEVDRWRPDAVVLAVIPDDFYPHGIVVPRGAEADLRRVPGRPDPLPADRSAKRSGD